MNKIEYPYQAFCRKSQNKKGDNGVTKKTLSVEVFCDSLADGQSPLEIFGPMSRAKITILHIEENNGQKTGTFCPWANLSQKEFAAVWQKSMQASMIAAELNSPMHVTGSTVTKNDLNHMYQGMQMMLNSMMYFMQNGRMPQMQNNPSSQNQVDLEGLRTMASANKLMGTMKGYTPLSFMQENNNEEGKQKMMGQITWLQGNLAQHPNNQKLIDSINAAIKLYDMKQLDGNGASTGSDIVIYESGPKGFNRKVKEDGFGPVKELTITWHLGDRYPVEISIVNYDAPIETKANGAINVMVAKRREPVVRESYRLTSDDYMDLLDKIRINFERYAYMMAAKQFEAANKASKANYEEYQQSQQHSGGSHNQPVQNQNQNAYQQPNGFQTQNNSTNQQVQQGQFQNAGYQQPGGFQYQNGGFQGGNPFPEGTLDGGLPFGKNPFRN